jgi:putative peptide zinc metalloprotease protein
MPEDQTFSESWYRIAGQRICLRPGVKVRRQNFRGERWIVLENPFSNQFFRLRPAAYEFVARLHRDRTVQEVWQECLDRFPDEAPGQQAVIQLLSQLYFANLLQYDLAADSAQLFERYKQRRQREIRSTLLNLMFMRFPLLDPDQFLVRTLPLAGKVINGIGAVVWLVVVGWALKVVADNFPALKEQSQSVLAPSNLPLLYLGLIIVKTIHEFGHAFFCRKFGGEVHVMGILLMIFTPVPYVDATSSWGFRSRWKRVLVGAAGMIVEIFVAALVTFVWANTGTGTLHSLAYNMMFIASVSTVLFNINPLLRFDGYYILSDLLDIPNLHQRAALHLRHLAERYLFGVKKSESPTQSSREKFWLTTFGCASWVYRIFVFGAILLFVADRFLLLGILMAVICLISWIIVPVTKFIQYLASSPKLDRVRHRAVAVSAGLAAGILILLDVIPFPSHFRAPGVLQARQRTEVVNESPGNLETILIQAGSRVDPGQALLQLANPELDMELEATRARLEESLARLRQARQDNVANIRPLNSRLESITNRLTKLEEDKDHLTLRARHAGIWVAPNIEDFLGRWLPRGTRLGLLVNPSAFEFTSTVRQEDVDALFSRHIPTAEVRLFGQVGTALPVEKITVIPAEQRTLPSPALGWRGGGEIAVSPEDPQGRRAAEPFFEVQAVVPPSNQVVYFHGRSGKIRFDLGSEPLLPRWIRRLRQMLQKRYQL